MGCRKIGRNAVTANFKNPWTSYLGLTARQTAYGQLGPIAYPLDDSLGDITTTIEQQLAAALATYSDAAWFDPSDLTSIFQDRDAYPDDSQGADGQPVGMWIDRSWGGENTTGATVAEMLAAATEVAANSGFDADSDWTKTTPGSSSITISGGTCTLQGGASEFPNIRQAVLTVGDWYHLSIDKLSGATSNQNDLEIRFGTGSGAFRLGTQPAGTYTIIQQAASTANFEIIKRGTETGPIEIDNVVLKRIPRLLVAPTDGERPTLTVSGGLTYLLNDGGDSLEAAPTFGALGASARAWFGAGRMGGFRFVLGSTGSTGQIWRVRELSNNLRLEVSGGGYTTSLDCTTDEVFGVVYGGGDLSDHVFHRNSATESATGSNTINTVENDVQVSVGNNTMRDYGEIFVVGEPGAADVALFKSWLAEKSGVTL